MRNRLFQSCSDEELRNLARMAHGGSEGLPFLAGEIVEEHEEVEHEEPVPRGKSLIMVESPRWVHLGGR